ncbi:MAG: hypothetical protein QXM46_02470 [Candidatus Hadarchaeales archaeon]
MRGIAALLDLVLFSLLVSTACLPLHLLPPDQEERTASSFGSHLALALQSVTLDSLGLTGGLSYKTVLGVLAEEAVLGREEVGEKLEEALEGLCRGRWICTLRVEVLQPQGRTILLELSTGKTEGRKRVYSTLLHRTLPPPEAGRVDVRLELWSL